MSNRKGSALNVIRYGQMLAHFIAMAKEVAGYIFLFGFIGLIFSFLLYLYLRVDLNQGLIFLTYLQADLSMRFGSSTESYVWVFRWGQTGYMSTTGAIYHQPGLREVYLQVAHELKIGSMIGAFSFVGIGVFCTQYSVRKGEEFGADQHIRGAVLGTVDEIKASLKKLRNPVTNKKLEPGVLKVGDVTVPREWEPQHLALIGGSGTGKSIIIADFIEQIVLQNKKAIVHDRSGTLLAKFYNPERDVVLNPLDIRHPKWSLFSECREQHDFETVAQILFPKGSGDPFWWEAPQLVFISLAMEESKRRNPSARRMAEMVLTCELEELIEACEGTYAASVMSMQTAKQSQSLRGIVATKLKTFMLTDDRGERDFSIRDWVASDEPGLIFITSKKDVEAYLKPLITIWVELAAISILSLAPSHSRRIFLLYDELQALGKMASLSSTLAEIRKYGGCAVVGFQGVSQGQDIYGNTGFDSLIDNCTTKVFLRANNIISAEWLAKQLGKSDIFEAKESLSYGVERVRDGVNMSVDRHQREVVTASQIKHVDDLHGYLDLSRGLPVVPFRHEYQDRVDLVPGFIPCPPEMQPALAATGPGESDGDGGTEYDYEVDLGSESLMDDIMPAESVHEHDMEALTHNDSFEFDNDAFDGRG